MTRVEAQCFSLVNNLFADSYEGSKGPVKGSVLLGAISYSTSGSFNLNQPISLLPLNFNGYVEDSFASYYYGTVWLLPAFLDFGEVSQTELLSTQIWHSYLYPNTLTALDILEPSNVSQNNLSVGYVFKPLELKQVNFTANKTGPSNINTVFSFELSNLIDFEITTFGVRSRQWGFEVNWQSGIEVVYEYKTDLIESRNGSLQRRAARKNPRRYLRYSSLITRDDSILFEALMLKSQSRLFSINDESLNAELATNALAGQSQIQLKYKPEWVQVGTEIVIGYKNLEESKTVSVINGNLVTLTEPLIFTHSADGLIRKKTPVLITTEQRLDKATNSTDVVTFDYAVPPGFETEWPNGESYPLFIGRELFLKKPNWINGISQTMQGPREELDYGQGVIDYNYPIEYNFLSRDLSFTCFDIREREELINFFKRRRGRAGSFWVPSWYNELKLLSPIMSGTNLIAIQDSLVFEYHDNSKTNKCLYIETVSGEYFTVKIDSMYLQGGNTYVIVESNFSRTITLEEITYFCWLHYCRFASDSLNVNMVTSTVSNINYPLIMMESI